MPFGWGGGRPMSGLFAAARPERVDRLGVLNPFARLQHDDDDAAFNERKQQVVDDVRARWGTAGASLAWVAPSAAEDDDAGPGRQRGQIHPHRPPNVTIGISKVAPVHGPMFFNRIYI